MTPRRRFYFLLMSTGAQVALVKEGVVVYLLK
jgi:hypothetical protein